MNANEPVARTPAGLSSAEASRRLRELGFNEPVAARRAIDGLDGEGIEERFDAESRGGMMAAAKGIGVEETQCAMGGDGVRWGNENVADADGARGEQPDGAIVARRGGRDGCVEGGEGNSGHAVRENGGEGCALGFDVECAEFEERIEGSRGSVGDVNTVRHSKAA